MAPFTRPSVATVVTSSTSRARRRTLATSSAPTLVVRATAGKWPSVRLFGAVDERGEGHQEDLQVEPERPVLDVVVVPLDAVAQRRLAPQAVDLGPAGDARLDAMAVVVARDPGAE